MAREIADRPKRPRGRRVTAAALGFLGVVGLGLGSASQVTLAPNPLGAGATTIAPPCQGSAPITATFTTAWQSNRFEATDVQLTGIDSACSGDTYYFHVITTTGFLDEETGRVTAGGATRNENITDTAVANIVRIELVIP